MSTSLETKARNAVREAKRKGILVPKPCEVCGEERTVGHHYLGYEKENWLKVRWFCGEHHFIAHFGTEKDLLKAQIYNHIYSENVSIKQLREILQILRPEAYEIYS